LSYLNSNLHYCSGSGNAVIGHHYGSTSSASSSYAGNTIGSVTLSPSIGYASSPPNYHQSHRTSSGEYHSGSALSPKSAHHLNSNYENVIHGSMYGNNGHSSGLMSGHHSQTVVHYAAPQQTHHVINN